MHTICVVVDNIEALLVVNSPQMSLSDGQTHGVSETLPKGTGGDFDT